MVLRWVTHNTIQFNYNKYYNIYNIYYFINIYKKYFHNVSYSTGIIDYRRIKIFAGNGGNGIVSYTAHSSHKRIGPGLPNGGRGGSGASIYAIGDRQARLSKLPGTVIGNNGLKGKGSNCSGDNGDDIILKVPIDMEESIERKFIACINDKTLLCKGGRGGRGNDMLNPYDCENGELGENGVFDFELERIAEVGLFGYPNVGKSTLLSCISRANPRIASFPYTTTQPCIGTLKFSDGKIIKVADLPGAIDGSISTLQHLERTDIIAYVIDKIDDFNRLRQLIKDYNIEMLNKPFFIIFTKMDLQIDYNTIDKFIEDNQISSQVVLVSLNHIQTSMHLNLGVTGNHKTLRFD